MQKNNPILLAEDDTNDIELTLAAFKENHLSNQVEVVRNGADAMDYLLYQGKYENRPKIKPILILLDNKMPKMTGLDVLKAVKGNPQLKSIPVVMLTSSSLESDIIRSYDLGANAYVVKPVNFTDFTEAVKTLGVFWSLINRIPKS